MKRPYPFWWDVLGALPWVAMTGWILWQGIGP